MITVLRPARLFLDELNALGVDDRRDDLVERLKHDLLTRFVVPTFVRVSIASRMRSIFSSSAPTTMYTSCA